MVVACVSWCLVVEEGRAQSLCQFPYRTFNVRRPQVGLRGAGKVLGFGRIG